MSTPRWRQNAAGASAGVTPVSPLGRDAVRVRWLSLADVDAERLSRWRRMLDARELRRANSYHFASDADAFVAAHALTRAMLSSATGKPTDSWRYSTGEFGKPGLA